MKNKPLLTKKTLTFSLISLLGGLLLALPVFAAPETASFGNLLAVDSVKDLLLAIIEHLQGIIAFIAVLFIVIAGIAYITAGGKENQIKLAKNIWVGSIIGLVLALLAPTILKEVRQIFFVGGALPTEFDDVPTLKDIILEVISFLLSILGILAIISLVISGFIYLFSLGDTDRAGKAKDMIKWSIVGLVLAGASVIIVKQLAEFIAP